MIIAAQAISLLAMASNISSYQFKKPKTIMLFQLIASVLFAVNLFMLDAATGAILNIIGIFRSLIYMNQERLGKLKNFFTVLLMLGYLGSYAATFLWLKKEPTVQNLIVEFLPLIGMAVITIGFSLNDAKKIRLLGFINSPCWLTYNAVHFSIGGILCEIFGLVSIISAFIRHDIKKKSRPATKKEDNI